MVTFEEARRLVLEAASPLSPEVLPLAGCLGRFLSEPLVARVDSPRFDNSAVDGYGVRISDTPGVLQHVGRSEAGEPSPHWLRPEEAVRVLTGAAIPRGVEAVVMQEDCSTHEETVSIRVAPKEGANIRRAGEEYRAGDHLLSAGTFVTPAVVGLSAANGLSHLAVGRVPRVAILVTGNELASAGTELGAGMIYESNGPALVAALKALGCHAESRVVRDEPLAIAEAMQQALQEAEVVFTTGGVSVGDRDHVRECATSLGVREIFWRVDMKPGKPVFFGTLGTKLVFGLPGNPVSALVTFHLLARPALIAQMGGQSVERLFSASIAGPIRKREGRAEFVRATVWREGDRLVVEPTMRQGSHMVGGIAGADCLIHLPAGSHDLPKGATVDVSMLQWGIL